jgi:hypothetical protein
MDRKKVLILILASSRPDYKKLEDSIKSTWFNLKNEDVEIIFYSDNDTELKKEQKAFLRGNNLILPCPDGHNYHSVKTVLALDWVLQNYDFDYIYRSNLGAFVYPDRIVKFLDDKPKEKFYCGIVGNDTFYFGRNIRFASGSGYFMSKDLVKLVCDKKNEFIYSMDDVAMGEFLNRHNIEINKSARRHNICDGKTFYQIGEQEVDNIPEEEIYHIRLRSDNRDIDIQNMKDIFQKIKNSYVSLYN